MSKDKAIRGSLSPIILSTLLDGDKYGYEILEEIKNRSNGTVILKQPSLYSSLRRMENQDYISSYWQDSDIGGKRHYYRLTEKGKSFYEKQKDSIDYSTLVDASDDAGASTEAIEYEEPEKVGYEQPAQIENNTEDPGLKVIKQESLFKLSQTLEEVKHEEPVFKKDNFEQINLFKTNMVGVIKPDNSVKYQKVDENELKQINQSQDGFSSFETIFPQDNTPLQLDISNLKTQEGDAKEVHLDFSSLINENNPKIDNKLINNNIYLKSNMEDYNDYTASDYNPLKYDDNTNPNANGNYILKKSTDPTKPDVYYMDVIDKLYAPYRQDAKEPVPMDEEIYEPDDDSDIIQDLNSELKSNGIRLRQYNKINRKFNPQDNCIRYNKLRMVEGWLVYGIALLEIWLTFMIIALTHALVPSHINFYIAATFVCLIYPIILTIIYFISPNFQIESHFKLGVGIFNKMLAMLITILFVFAICLLIGMTSLKDADFFSFWIVPTVLTTNYITSSCIYYLLIKSRRFCY